MKAVLQQIMAQACARAMAGGALPQCALPPIVIEEPRQAEHGDLACTLPLQLAKSARMNPRAVAQAITAHIADNQGILGKVEIAGPGFINFFIQPLAWLQIINQVLEAGAAYGHSQSGQGKKVMVEFVSANPTGPLHVGHGRGAVLGDVIARLLHAVGYDVLTEYYLNDAGNQMATLGRSVIYRARELMGDNSPFPDNHYRGEYIYDLARQFLALPAISQELNPARAAEQLSQWAEDNNAQLELATQMAGREILDGIKKDLADFGVFIESYFSEKSLLASGAVEQAFASLRQAGLLYENEGALWFASSRLGDDKDRVVRRGNGELTYFASDIAYHQNKLARGYGKLVDVWGADHHGYVPRVRAAMEGLGSDKNTLTVVLVQMVRLLRGGELVSMSTRAGQFDTLAQVVEEVGSDSARFIFLTRRSDAGLDFDLTVAKQKSMDNPVFYVQYAHTRVCSLLRKAGESGLAYKDSAPDLSLLTLPEEVALVKTLGQFPQLVEDAAHNLEPHRLTFYLRELAQMYHSYYNDKPVLQERPAVAVSRLALSRAVAQVIKNGLNLLGVSAPEHM